MVKTPGLGEALVKRRLKIISDTMEEYGLAVEIVYVPTALNKADSLTWVPKEKFKESDDARLLDSVEGAEYEELGDAEANAEESEYI